MVNSRDTPFLENERKKTDDSLIAEREKTNESLTKAKASAERQTDQRVQGERRRTDQMTSEARENADFEAQKKRDESGGAADNGEPVGKDRLLSERDQSDKAIERERSQVDRAIDRERELKNRLAAQVLEQERKLTDQNLSTERKRADLEVRRTADLLSEEIAEHSKTRMSLTARDRFLAIVSHDLKNPMGSAVLSAEMLLEDPAIREFGAEARTSIELIKRNIETSLRLIADLLDMERIESGKVQLALKKNDIGQMIREAVESFAPLALSKSVSLRTTAMDLSGDVLCDRERIRQVLSNLIGNALKFTPQGGSVEVGAVFLEDAVQVSVIDSGPGIPEEKRVEIFERHSQLGSGEGVGLGLYISKMLVEAHRGRLWVQSKIGVGSTFNFTIPRPLN